MGPEAKAGSIFLFFRIRGIVPPSETATSVFIVKADPTTKPRYILPFHNQAAKPINKPSTSPLINPTDTSYSQTRNVSFGFTIPMESSLILTATAWLPVQPLMSEMIGRKTASAITAVKVS